MFIHDINTLIDIQRNVDMGPSSDFSRKKWHVTVYFEIGELYRFK